MIRCQQHKHWGEGDRKAERTETSNNHSTILLKEEKYAKKFSEIKNMLTSTISSNRERPWRPNFLLSYFKVCFSFSSCLDSIKQLVRKETVWRSYTTIYSHPKNNICPFNEYNKPLKA